MTQDQQLIVLAFGEGGHRAQARRLIEKLTEIGPLPRLLCLTDKGGIALEGSAEIVFSPLRQKSDSSWGTLRRVISGIIRNSARLLQLIRICRKVDAVVMVSLGPAFVVLPALAVRALGGQVVHIETWSRFTTRSMTGRIMYPLANQFWVQNQELIRLYPRATYCGRL